MAVACRRTGRWRAAAFRRRKGGPALLVLCCAVRASAPRRSRVPAARASEEEDARGEREDDDGEDEDELGAEQDLLQVVEESPQRRAGDLAEEGEVGLLAERGGARRRQLTLLGCSRRGKEHEGRGGERNM